MPKHVVNVAAGILIKPNGKLLLTQRPQGKPWAGWWEFPGGKIEAGETPQQALQRELNEEIGITVTQASPWVNYKHNYDKALVNLYFFKVTEWRDKARGLENQQLAWIDPNKPTPIDPVLPATLPPLRWIKLQQRYLITSINAYNKLPVYLHQLQNALEQGIQMVQFREPVWAANKTDQQDLFKAFKAVLALCRRHKAICLVNSVHPESWWQMADGVHLRANDATALAASGYTNPLGTNYVGISAHNEAELLTAQKINADFAVVGHVLNTPSHPNEPAMGWDQFAALSRQANMPVFAIGGQSEATLRHALESGAQGIAAIRGLLTPAAT